MTVVAIVFCCLLAALAVFQIALIAGVPWGRFAWGGQDAVLPKSKRRGSVVSIVLYVLFGYFALEKARSAGTADGSSLVVSIVMWVITGYLVLGILMNAVSRSKPERFTMVPVSAVLAALALVLALA